MTAIKWYLFSYRLHFNQISLDYTVVNAQSTVLNNCNTVNCNECTVNCALDIVNRLMSYILYLSLRWSYEVGRCNIAISVIRAIKWYLFCYRVDFNQKSLNYTVVNAQSTVPNAVNCALDIVNRMISYILYLSLPWSYEVGSCNIVISVRWQLSNDIYLVIDYILTRYR